MDPIELELESLETTARTGREIAQGLPERALLLVSGGLGAGKTTLIKAICAGLGIPPQTVISPTYTLVNVYPGPPPVYHVDLFRIERAEALLEIDRDDWINPEGPTLIEWPEVAATLLDAAPALRLTLAAPAGQRGEDSGRRLLTARGGPAYEPLLSRLAGLAPAARPASESRV